MATDSRYNLRPRTPKQVRKPTADSLTSRTEALPNDPGATVAGRPKKGSKRRPFGPAGQRDGQSADEALYSGGNGWMTGALGDVVGSDT